RPRQHPDRVHVTSLALARPTSPELCTIARRYAARTSVSTPLRGKRLDHVAEALDRSGVEEAGQTHDGGLHAETGELPEAGYLVGNGPCVDARGVLVGGRAARPEFLDRGVKLGGGAPEQRRRELGEVDG